MNNRNSPYQQKTIIREMLFSAHMAGSIDKESLISRLNISLRQFYRLQNKYRQDNIQRKCLTVEEELEGVTLNLTDFGKVCARLGIEHIFAYSPQAKGRVENKHKLYKDRCIKEIKWLNYSTIDQVNKFLHADGGFTDRLNKKFTIAPKEANSESNFLNCA